MGPRNRVGPHHVSRMRVWVAAGFLSLASGLGFSHLASALSLYDVIQLSRAGYTDKEIVRLIEITGAQFEVDPKTLVTLKKEGVSEVVMRALIGARSGKGQLPASVAGREGASPLQPSTESGAEPANSHPDEAEEDTGHDHPPPPSVSSSSTDVVARPPSARPAPTAQPFSYFPFEETGGAHGSSDQHYGVAVYQIPLLVLRSEGRSPRISQRARDVVDLLNQIVQSPAGRFIATPGQPPVVAYRTEDPGEAVPVLEVTRGDAIAYQQRSLGPVSAEKLAAYWAAVFNDYTQLFLFGRPPAELGKLHLGETLNRIHADLNLVAGQAGKVENDLPLPSMLRLMDHLAAEDKEHLLEIATRIPAEFRVR